MNDRIQGISHCCISGFNAVADWCMLHSVHLCKMMKAWLSGRCTDQFPRII